MMLYVARCKRAGFTLIEIMIVIAIIAILAGIAIPNIQQARAEAQLAGCRQNIMNIVKALEMASIRCSYKELAKKMGSSSSITGYTDTKSHDYLLENGYLSCNPRCPASSASDDGRYYSEIVYNNQQGNIGTGIRVVCSGYHFVANQKIKPRYSLTSGTQKIGKSPTAGWCDSVTTLD